MTFALESAAAGRHVRGVGDAGMRAMTWAVSLSLLTLSYAPAWAEVLITPREASYQDSDKRDRGPMMGPKVTLATPASAVKSPFTLNVRFEGRDGVPVDLNSLVVIYEKTPQVDLIERLRPYLTPAGISMPQAETPPGLHRIRVEIKDVNGRLGGAEITLDVAP